MYSAFAVVHCEGARENINVAFNINMRTARTCVAVLCVMSFGAAAAEKAPPTIFGLPFSMPVFRSSPPLEYCYDQNADRKAARACLTDLKAEAETLLNETVARVKATMRELDRRTKRNQALRAFEKSQKQFVVWRETNCGFYSAQSVMASGEADLALDCYIRMTNGRRRELMAFAGEQPTPQSSAESPSITSDASAAAPTVPSNEAASPGTAEQDKLSGLVNVDWRLREITEGTRRVVIPEGALVTLRLGDGARVSGNAGVNRYLGAYRFSADAKLEWNGEFAVTRAAGPPELMEFEQAYLKALARVSSAMVDGKTLRLTDRSSELTLTFSKP